MKSGVIVLSTSRVKFRNFFFFFLSLFYWLHKIVVNFFWSGDERKFPKFLKKKAARGELVSTQKMAAIFFESPRKKFISVVPHTEKKNMKFYCTKKLRHKREREKRRIFFLRKDVRAFSLKLKNRTTRDSSSLPSPTASYPTPKYLRNSKIPRRDKNSDTHFFEEYDPDESTRNSDSIFLLLFFCSRVTCLKKRCNHTTNFSTNPRGRWIFLKLTE